MKLRLDVSPQARRDLASILDWYKENMGAGAALKVAQTVQSRLRALAAGRLKGATAPSETTRYLRTVAKKHVINFQVEGGVARIARIVHGAQDVGAVVSKLDEA